MTARSHLRIAVDHNVQGVDVPCGFLLPRRESNIGTPFARVSERYWHSIPKIMNAVERTAT
jgi:hypothetical protein